MKFAPGPQEAAESTLRTVVDAATKSSAGAPVSVGVAVSGGVDSLVLLHTAARAAGRFASNLRIVALHVVHNLRSEAEQRADRRVLLAVAVRHGLRFQILEGRPGQSPQRMSRESGGVEADARNYRYSLLEAEAARLGLAAVLVAQHLDDRIETFVLKVFTSSDAAGLTAFGTRSPLFLRPFADLRKDAILDYARMNLLEWHEDSSNPDTRYLRNWVRQIVLPGIRGKIPGIDKTLPRLLADMEQQGSDPQFLELEKSWESAAGGFRIRRSAIAPHKKSVLKKSLKNRLRALLNAEYSRESFVAELAGPRPNRTTRISDRALEPVIAAVEGDRTKASVLYCQVYIDLDAEWLSVRPALEKAAESGYLVTLQPGQELAVGTWRLLVTDSSGAGTVRDSLPGHCWIIGPVNANNTGFDLWEPPVRRYFPKNLPRDAKRLSILRQSGKTCAILGEYNNGSGFVTDAEGNKLTVELADSERFQSNGPMTIVWRTSSER